MPKGMPSVQGEYDRIYNRSAGRQAIPRGSVWKAVCQVLAELGRNPGVPLFGALYGEERAARPDGFAFDHGWPEQY